MLLFGPTAVGKTDFLNNLYPRNFEIISADALQVYRGLDVGTAKPSKEEQEKIPHHLIDVRDPSESFDAGSFVAAADELAKDIRSRGRLPIVAGGTAFYLIRFLYGLPETPPADVGLRRKLEVRAEKEGTDALYRELAELDPITRERIHPNDAYRILRALEVYYATGHPLSDYRVPSQPRSDWSFTVAGLYRDREELYCRIDERVEKMWRHGLPREIDFLISRGCRESDPGMKGIGYREFFLMRRLGEWTIERVKEEIKKNSRRYAKRQLSFFRRIGETRWFRADSRDELRRLEDILQHKLKLPENRDRL